MEEVVGQPPAEMLRPFAAHGDLRCCSQMLEADECPMPPPEAFQHQELAHSCDGPFLPIIYFHQKMQVVRSQSDLP